jgi:uncharacterized protein YdaU (DUF1376 family)
MPPPPFFATWAEQELAETAFLTTEECGAYWLLRVAMWRTEALALRDEDRFLSRVARTPLRRWRSTLRPALERLFVLGGGMWRHDGLEKERQHIAKISDQRSRARAAALEAKRLIKQETTSTNGHPYGRPYGQPNGPETLDSDSEPESEREDSNTASPPASESATRTRGGARGKQRGGGGNGENGGTPGGAGGAGGGGTAPPPGASAAPAQQEAGWLAGSKQGGNYDSRVSEETLARVCAHLGVLGHDVAELEHRVDLLVAEGGSAAPVERALIKGLKRARDPVAYAAAIVRAEGDARAGAIEAAKAQGKPPPDQMAILAEAARITEIVRNGRYPDESFPAAYRRLCL